MNSAHTTAVQRKTERRGLSPELGVEKGVGHRGSVNNDLQTDRQMCVQDDALNDSSNLTAMFTSLSIRDIFKLFSTRAVTYVV